MYNYYIVANSVAVQLKRAIEHWEDWTHWTTRPSIAITFGEYEGIIIVVPDWPDNIRRKIIKIDFLKSKNTKLWKMLIVRMQAITWNVRPSLWPSGIDSRLGRNRSWVRWQCRIYIPCSMFIEPTITWVPSGFSGYIWLDTKIVLKTLLR